MKPLSCDENNLLYIERSLMNHRKSDRSQINYREITLAQWIQKATFSRGQKQNRMLLASLSFQPKAYREHTERTTQIKAKTIPSLSLLSSYSTPPGVSWPLGNFLLNYTAGLHLWSIMILSPSALCCKLISITVKCLTVQQFLGISSRLWVI